MAKPVEDHFGQKVLKFASHGLIEIVAAAPDPRIDDSYIASRIRLAREAAIKMEDPAGDAILSDLEIIEEAIAYGDIQTACVHSMYVGIALGENKKFRDNLLKAREARTEQVDDRRQQVVDLFNALSADRSRKKTAIYAEITQRLQIPTRTVQKYVAEAGLAKKRKTISGNRAQD